MFDKNKLCINSHKLYTNSHKYFCPLWRVIWSCFDWFFWHHRVSGRNSKNNGLRTGALFFSSPRVALRAKYRVHPAWLIKRLPCRLALTCNICVEPTHLYLFLSLKIAYSASEKPCNRPLPSSKNPHFQNEARRATFLWKWVLFPWEWKMAHCLFVSPQVAQARNMSVSEPRHCCTTF